MHASGWDGADIQSRYSEGGWMTHSKQIAMMSPILGYSYSWRFNHETLNRSNVVVADSLRWYQFGDCRRDGLKRVGGDLFSSDVLFLLLSDTCFKSQLKILVSLSWYWGYVVMQGNRGIAVWWFTCKMRRVYNHWALGLWYIFDLPSVWLLCAETQILCANSRSTDQLFYVICHYRHRGAFAVIVKITDNVIARSASVSSAEVTVPCPPACNVTASKISHLIRSSPQCSLVEM